MAEATKTLIRAEFNAVRRVHSMQTGHSARKGDRQKGAESRPSSATVVGKKFHLGDLRIRQGPDREGVDVPQQAREVSAVRPTQKRAAPGPQMLA